MNLFLSQLSLESEIVYPESDGEPMAESDPTRDYLVYSVEALSIHFEARSDVYISGNLFIYYRQGVPDAVVAPDVFVVFGVEKKKRRTYKVWEEGGHIPAFVMEITSKSTQEKDETDKRHKYESLGVLEYFQYDPTGDYLNPPLKGLRLVDGQYQPIAATALEGYDRCLHSQALGLDLRVNNGELRYFDPATRQQLLTHQETEHARQQAEQARQQAEQARRDAVPRLLAMGLSLEQVAAALGLSISDLQE